MKKFYDILRESSLSRIWQHSNSEISIGIITAFRNEHTKKQNIERNKELAAKIKNVGYGYFYIDGYWIENQGTDKEFHVSEKSIFIIGNEKDNGKLKWWLKKWIMEYNQDAAILKAENSDDLEVINNDGSMIKIGKFSPNKIAQAYSNLKKGRTFVLESFEYDSNWLGKFNDWVTSANDKPCGG
jgi:hypothetical protein